MRHKFFYTPLLLVLLSFSCFAQDAPPKEVGNFRKPDLVELIKLDNTFKLDIRYATSSNFTGRPVYTEARAFLQRPAAESLVRVSKKLKDKGYGLMIFDGYRPWNVTKLFWDITPQDKKKFVADPAKGSRHNRGCAVDLTLYDLKTGMEVTMTGYYDEMSERSHPDYKGGTTEQRAARNLLRSMMESEGFTVYEEEWWHFDYKDWKEYPILNVKFSEIAETEPTIVTKENCEMNIIGIANLAAIIATSSDVLFIVAHLGDGENSRSLNLLRLNTIRNRFSFMSSKKLFGERIFFVEGKPVTGKGRIEFYMRGEVWQISFMERGQNICF